MKFSIVMPLYIRFDGLESILNEIFNARESVDFDLFFFIDGANSEQAVEVQSSILDFLKKFQNLKWITLVHRERNMGLKRNIESALDYVSANYDAFMVIEDDCLISESGILSIFSFLEKNQSRHNQILALNSVSFNFRSSDFCWEYSDRLISWGWGTWSEIWQEYRKEKLTFSRDQLFKSIPKHWTLFERIFVKRMYKKVQNLDTWAIPFSVYLRLNGYIASPSCNYTNILDSEFSTHSRWHPRLEKSTFRVLEPTISGDCDFKVDRLKKLSRSRSFSLTYGFCIYLIRKLLNFNK